MVPSPKDQALVWWWGAHSASPAYGSRMSPTSGPFVTLGLLLPHPAPLRLRGQPAPAHPCPSRAHGLQPPGARGREWVGVAAAQVSGVCGRLGPGRRLGPQIAPGPQERPPANHDVIHGSADPRPVGLQLLSHSPPAEDSPPQRGVSPGNHGLAPLALAAGTPSPSLGLPGLTPAPPPRLPSGWPGPAQAHTGRDTASRPAPARPRPARSPRDLYRERPAAARWEVGAAALPAARPRVRRGGRRRLCVRHASRDAGAAVATALGGPGLGRGLRGLRGLGGPRAR